MSAKKSEPAHRLDEFLATEHDNIKVETTVRNADAIMNEINARLDAIEAYLGMTKE